MHVNAWGDNDVILYVTVNAAMLEVLQLCNVVNLCTRVNSAVCGIIHQSKNTVRE